MTRELSEQTVSMIRNWIEKPVYDKSYKAKNKELEIKTIDQLENVLQKCLYFEHMTIALYGSALYSIRPRSNPSLHDYLKRVFKEEMSHMCMIGNFITALGR